MTTTTRRITIDVPEDVWSDFVRSAGRHKLSVDKVLLDFVRRYPVITENKQQEYVGFYSELTYRCFSGELERNGSINDIKLDSDDT